MKDGRSETEPVVGDEQALAGPTSEGLDAGPFHGDAGNFLTDECASLRGALEDVANQCRYAGDVVLASLAAPGLQSTLTRRVEQLLGDGMRVVTLRADMLMGPLDLLRRLAAALDLDDSLRDSASADLLLDEILAQADRIAAAGEELLIQLRDAHELGGEALDMLATLGDPDDEGAAPRLLLWAGPGAEAALEGVFEERGLALVRVAVPGFDKHAVRRYLEHSLEDAGYTGSFPFSAAQVAAIHRQAEGDPACINRLARETLSREAGDEAEGGRFRLPLPHALAGCGLVAVLALLYVGSREDVSEPPANRDAAGPAAAVQAATGGAQGEPAATGFADTRSPAVAVSNPDAEKRERMPADSGAPGGAGADSRSGAAGADKTAADIADSATGPEHAAARPEASPPAQTAAAGEPVDAAKQADAAIREPAAQSSAPAATAPETAPAEGSLAHHHQALRGMPRGNYAIQLMGAFAEDGVRGFVERHTGQDLLYFRTQHQGRPWYVVVAASFPSRSEADRALARLPDEARRAGPWVRKVEDILPLLQD